MCVAFRTAGRHGIVRPTFPSGMATLHQQIVEKFLEQLTIAKTIDPARVDKLRTLLKEKKKAKVEDLTAIFLQPPGDEVK